MPPAPHDPREREVVLVLGTWTVRMFEGRKLEYFAPRGLAHLQLWHEASGVSILTPSRLTLGAFEVFPSAGWKRRTKDYRVLADLVLREHGVAVPPAPEVARAQIALVDDLVRAQLGVAS